MKVTLFTSLFMMMTFSVNSKVESSHLQHEADKGFVVIKIELNSELMATREWSDWGLTDCFKGLEFRVQYRGENYDGTKHKWGVQLRNKYGHGISFNYEVFDHKPAEGSNPNTTNRKSLDPGEESSTYRDFYMKNSESVYVYVYVDRMRFGDKDSGDYVNCDR